MYAQIFLLNRCRCWQHMALECFTFRNLDLEPQIYPSHVIDVESDAK